MGYQSKTLDKALDIKLQSAKEHRARFDKTISEVYAKTPRLFNIDNELSKNGASAAIKAINGDLESLKSLREVSQKLSDEKQKILKDAGVNEFKPLCPLCNDTGFVKGTLCECVKNIAKGLLVNELNEQLPLNTSRFDNFDLKFYPNVEENGVNSKKRMSAIFDFCKNYANSFTKSSESLLFLGGAGLGKTHLSLAIGAAVIEKGYGVIYGSAGNLFSKIEKEYFSRNEPEFSDAVLECDLLIIDDLGTEFSTQFTHSALYNIINTRILANKPTLINTNLSFAEIEERYTARISSRLAGSYTIKKFIGNDIRIIKATNK